MLDRASTLAGVLAGAVACISSLVALPARANDFDQFQNARAAYDSVNYELSADLFRGLLDDASEDDRRPLILESRKYLAAAYLFLGRTTQAEQEIERLLRAEPQYVLDPLGFPQEVHEAFARVRQRLEEERVQLEEEQRQLEAARRRAGELDAKKRTERLRRLLKLATTERVEHSRSRWVAMLPFGIGQFQNGDNGLGLVLAVTETTLLLAGTTAYFLHDALPARPDPQDEATVEDLEIAYRIGNQVATGLFAVIAVTGIIDAQLRFKPSSSEDRERPLPEDLKDIELEFSVSPTGVSLGGRF